MLNFRLEIRLNKYQLILFINLFLLYWVFYHLRFLVVVQIHPLKSSVYLFGIRFSIKIQFNLISDQKVTRYFPYILNK